MEYVDEGEELQADSFVILDKRDSAFVDKWKPKTKDVPVVSKKGHKNGGRNSQFRDPAIAAELRRLWMDGVRLRVIAEQYGCTIYNIEYWVNKLKLPPRVVMRPRKMARFSLWLSASMNDKVDIHIVNRYRNKSEYVRSLIARDLGIPNK